MDDELMMQILSLGNDEEAIADLLRQADRQEGLADATRGRDYLMDAGRMKVANPWGAISDVFVRGNAEKRAKELRGQAPNMRATINERMRDFINSSQGKGLGGVDFDDQPTQRDIAGMAPGAGDLMNVKVPPAPQVPPMPAPAAPRPPVPAAGPTGAPAAPVPPAGRPGPFIANLPGQPQPGDEPDGEAILALLRQQNQGGVL